MLFSQLTTTILLLASLAISHTTPRDVWGPKSITMCKHSGFGPNSKHCEYSCSWKCDEPSPEEARDLFIKSFARARIDCVPSRRYTLPTLLCNKTQVGDCAWFSYKCMQFDDSTEEEAYWNRMHPDSESDIENWGLGSDYVIEEEEYELEVLEELDG